MLGLKLCLFSLPSPCLRHMLACDMQILCCKDESVCWSTLKLTDNLNGDAVSFEFINLKPYMFLWQVYFLSYGKLSCGTAPMAHVFSWWKRLAHPLSVTLINKYLWAGWDCHPISLITAHFCAQKIYIRTTRGQLVQ